MLSLFSGVASMIPASNVMSGTTVIPSTLMQPVSSSTGTLASLVTSNPVSLAMYSLPKSANQTVETYIQSACNQQPANSQSVIVPTAHGGALTTSHPHFSTHPGE